MKYFNLFLSIIIFASTVFCKIDDCPDLCNIVNQCITELGITGKYTVYPPKEDLGKCFCQDVQQYFTCLDCSQNKENKKSYVIGSVTGACNKLLGLVGTNGVGTTGTTAGNTAGNVAGTGNTAGTTGTTAGTTVGGSTTGTTGDTGNNISNGNASSANNKTNSNSKSNSNNSDTDSKTNENKQEGGKGGKIGIVVIAIVAAVAVIGFFVYTRNQKARPESMPFFGNSAASPNHYATLGSAKEINDMSTSNLTTDYNSQFYPNVDNSNTQYSYNQSVNYNNPYEAPQQQSFSNQYDPNFQDVNNQYGNYEGEVAPLSTVPSGAAATTAANNGAHYESRRESMIPGTQPTSNTFSGAYVCAYKYEPQLDDELELQVNDQVQIIEEYEDGWMKAINLTSGKEGMAPRVCIKLA